MPILIYYLVFAFLIGCFAWFFWKCIGSPEVDSMGIASNYEGWIFSFYGKWICAKYNQKENDNSLDIADKISDFLGEPYSEGSKLTLEQQKAIEAIRDNRPLNFYKPLGVCLLCMSYWFGLLGCIGIVVFSQTIHIYNSIFVLAFLPPFVVVVAKKISE